MRSSTRNAGVLVLLFTGVLMGALDISIVGPAIPSIGQTIRVETRELSWIFNSYILFNLAGISLFAKLSDRFGRKSVYIAAVSIFAAGSLIVALADNYLLLVTGRAIQGLGSSGIFPVALATVGDLFPVSKRGRALGLIGAVFGIAFLAGPFIAGTILRYFPWNALFLINIPVAVLIILFSLRLLPGRIVGREVRIDYAGIILMGASLALYTIALTNLDTTDFVNSLFSVKVLPLLVFATILAVILFMVEKTEKDPVLEVKFFRSREIRLTGIIAIGLGLFQSSILFLPAMAVSRFGVTPSDASFMLVPLVLMTALGSPLNGRLVDLIGSRIIIVAGLIIAAGGLYLLGTALADRITFYLAGGLLGFGLSMRAALNYIMLNAVNELERASSQGMLLIFISIGQITGASFIGVMAAAAAEPAAGFSTAFLMMSGAALLLGVLALFLKGKSNGHGAEPIKEISNQQTL